MALFPTGTGKLKPNISDTWGDGLKVYYGPQYERNFDGQDLSWASFNCDDLRRASFKGANLTQATFRGCRITEETNFEGAIMPHFQFVPEIGSFLAYKPLFNPYHPDKLLLGKVKVLEDSLRTSVLGQRKARVSKVLTIKGTGESVPAAAAHPSNYLYYSEGEVTSHEKYNSDFKIGNFGDRLGIDIFLTEREAQSYIDGLKTFYEHKTEYTCAKSHIYLESP